MDYGCLNILVCNAQIVGVRRMRQKSPDKKWMRERQKSRTAVNFDQMFSQHLDGVLGRRNGDVEAYFDAMGKFCNSKRTFTTHDPDENISGDAALSPIAEDWSKQGIEEWKASRRYVLNDGIDTASTRYKLQVVKHIFSPQKAISCDGCGFVQYTKDGLQAHWK
ncbi:hypothetical protein SCARD494_12802 [Seiridium cardinale]